MKIDCYDACKCSVIDIAIGDTFYYNDNLYLRIDGFPNLDAKAASKVWAVDLGKGLVVWLEHDCQVTFASCKVVANSKEIE